MEYFGIDYLRRQLAAKAVRVGTRYRFYDMKNVFTPPATVIPPQFLGLSNVLGWCAKAVDTLTGRLRFDGFEGDDFYLGEIFDLNNPDVLTRSAVNDALIGSCSFIYISADRDGYPRLQVICLQFFRHISQIRLDLR